MRQPEQGIAGFYLDERVVVTAFLPDGWCLARSRKGRVWRHWADQIKTEPWGDVAVLGLPGEGEVEHG